MTRNSAEWPTIALIVVCYGVWALGVGPLSQVWQPLGILVTALCVALHSSLRHEALHGHPFRTPWLNEALVFPALDLTIPYRRFQDQHLEHHNDAVLTDPYDDPESNYLDPEVWASLSPVTRAVLAFNNTLLGRVLVGPVVGHVIFLTGEWTALRQGQGRVALAWGLHLLGVAIVLVALQFAVMPVWAYLIAAYCGHGLIKIRTFLEHQAHEHTGRRTVIVEDRGPLALLFLNNNFHVVHHMHPNVPWYMLPGLYRARAERYLTRNGDYRFGSYGQIARRYLLRRKDPVAHPYFHR